MAAAEYAKILAQRQKEAKEAKELKRRRSVTQISLPTDGKFRPSHSVNCDYYCAIAGLPPFASPSALCPASRLLSRLYMLKI